jgi:hypothetical protein
MHLCFVILVIWLRRPTVGTLEMAIAVLFPYFETINIAAAAKYFLKANK